jgi:hypothetical protein
LRKRIAAFATTLYLNAKKASVPEKIADDVNHLPFSQAISRLELMTLTLKVLRMVYLTTVKTAGRRVIEATKMIRYDLPSHHGGFMNPWMVIQSSLPPSWLRRLIGQPYLYPSSLEDQVEGRLIADQLEFF